MAYESLIPESEASTLAAVSTRTLERFAEAGYLRVETGMNGIKLFSRSEVEHLFGVKNKRIEKTVYHSSPPVPVESPSEEEPLENASPVSSQPDQATAPLSDTRSLDLQKQISSLESELASMRTLVEIQEKLLDARDAQLQDIKEQRDWLKSRIEKLELKGERDQILLLSGNQTVRKLIAISEQNRSPMRAALEWLGFAPQRTSDESISNTLEHK